MKILFIVVAIAIISATNGFKFFGKGRNGFMGPPSRSVTFRSKVANELWFKQKLDHFDPTNEEEWNQRYYVNEKFYRRGGPVFLMIGGEGEATEKWMNEGAWIQYAKVFGAYCIQLEHRFYGKSHPTEDLSIKNLKYLSSEQALADIANFVEKTKDANRLTGEWIAFGGSYPGSLAAWVREKYPHLIHGAISSSGPLLAKVDFFEYYDVVVASLKSYNEKCVEAVAKSFQQVEMMMNHRIGQRGLTDAFKLCDTIEGNENQLDISNFFENLASNFAGVVQYNKDNSPHATVTIDTVCDIMMNDTIGIQVTRLGAVNSLMLEQSKDKCLDYKYDKMVQEMRNTSWDSGVAGGSRQWTYQTCTEFGFYQTSDKKEKVFGNRFDAKFFIKQCLDVYSERFGPDYLDDVVERTNVIYGALKPQTTNVLYVHGSIDPWHALGLTDSNDSHIPTIFIEGTAHCANMYEPSSSDFPQLIKAREQIQNYIANLLK